MVEGSTPASARATRRRRGRRPSSLALRRLVTTTAAAAVVDAAGVAGGDDAPFFEGGTQAGEGLHAAVGAGLLVRVGDLRLLADLHLNGHDLILELARLHGGDGSLVAAQRHLVLLLAGDVVLLGQVLGGDAHVHLAEGVAQDELDGVLEHAVAEAVAEAALTYVVGEHAHVLDAAGEDDLGVAALDPAGGGIDRLQAAAADAADVVGGHLDGQAGLDGGMTGDVGVLHHLPDTAQDHLVDLLRAEAGALHRRFQDYRRQIGRRDVLEDTAQPSDGGARSADKDNFLHAALLSWVVGKIPVRV